jgi:hypothetical protein
LGPLSLDSFRKNKLSASWKVIGGETPVDNKAASEVRMTVMLWLNLVLNTMSCAPFFCEFYVNF